MNAELDYNKKYLIHGVFGDGTIDNPSSNKIEQILDSGIKSKMELEIGNSRHDDHYYVYFSLFNSIPDCNAIIVKASPNDAVCDHDMSKIGGPNARWFCQLKDYDPIKRSNNMGNKIGGMAEFAFLNNLPTNRFAGIVKLEKVIDVGEFNSQGDIDKFTTTLRKKMQKYKMEDIDCIKIERGGDKIYIRVVYDYKKYKESKKEIEDFWKNIDHKKLVDNVPETEKISELNLFFDKNLLDYSPSIKKLDRDLKKGCNEDVYVLTLKASFDERKKITQVAQNVLGLQKIEWSRDDAKKFINTERSTITCRDRQFLNPAHYKVKIPIPASKSHLIKDLVDEINEIIIQNKGCWKK